jgi:hypothetical protein
MPLRWPTYRNHPPAIALDRFPNLQQEKLSALYFLRIHPPHGSIQLGLGDVEIAQSAIVIDPRLGE